jgi:glycerol uptake facilitator protein
MQVALMWGFAVTMGVYASRSYSCAHINPAVSLAMAVGKRISVKTMLVYFLAQFLGAFLAAALLYALFSGQISQFEAINGIVRGSEGSIRTAMMFGEFYPNPSLGDAFTVSTLTAFFAEALGTFFLVLMVFSLTESCSLGRPDNSFTPLFIGMTVAAIIGVIAPLTQAGINPARDLAPRVFAYLAGWGKASLPDKHYGFLTVYVLAPFVGGTLASLIFFKFLKPMVTDKIEDTCKIE